MALSESRKQANARWDRENTKWINFKLMIKSDADVIAQIQRQPNRTEYLRRLVRDDLLTRVTEGAVYPEDE